MKPTVTNDTMSQKTNASAVAMAVLAVVASLLVFAPVSGADAAGEDLSAQYGTATEIEIAPGFEWRYTPTFPSDLTEYVTVTLEVDDTGTAVVDGRMVIVSIADDAVVGTVYNVVMKAHMSEPVEQTAYQYVRFTVVDGLDVSGTIDDIIQGTSVDFTPSGSSDMGTVTWTIKSGTTLPAGLELMDGKVVGTPTELGRQTVSLTANSHGETADLEVSFTVYSKIVGDSAETITSHGTTVSSRSIVNNADIGVTWSVTDGSLPDGFTLDPLTGVVSGSSTAVRETVVTITGTSANGPAQSTTKDITIRSEALLSLTSGNDILTYKGNRVAVTSQVTATETSAIAWTVSQYSGVTIHNGLVSVVDSQTPGMDQTITVTATTAYGQTETIEIGLSVEDTLTITGDSVVNAIAGTAKQSSAFSVTGGSGNTLACTTDAVGLDASIVDGKLRVSSASPAQDLTVTVTVASAAGQTASHQVTVDVYNVLTFTSGPSGGAIIYAM